MTPEEQNQLVESTKGRVELMLTGLFTAAQLSSGTVKKPSDIVAKSEECAKLIVGKIKNNKVFSGL